MKYSLDNDTTRFAWATDTESQMIINLASCCSNGAPLVRQPSFDGSIDAPEIAEYYYAWGAQEDVDDGDVANFIYSKNEVIENGETVLNWSEDALYAAKVINGGKGVIYWMKDEYNNECPYDFKNIQFSRCLDEEGSLDLKNGETTWCYTFGGKQCDRSIRHDGLKEYNNNSIGTYYVGCNDVFSIPNNVFLGVSECMTKDNKLGNDCYNNTFGDKCQFNIFGNTCQANTFGDGCNANTFGNGCDSNTFGDHCTSNTFGDYCISNTFGNNCHANTFGNNCDNNTFGNSNSNPISYVYYVRFADGSNSIKLLNTETASLLKCVKDITVATGVRGTPNNPCELQVFRNAPPIVFEAAGTTHIILD